MDLAKDPRRIRSFLLDLAGSERREINLLVIAAQEGIPSQIKAASSAPITMIIPRLANSLRVHWGLSPQAAHWAVASWAQALGVLDGEFSLPPSGLHTAPRPAAKRAIAPPNKANWRLETGPIQLDLVHIPGGVFQMGAGKEDQLAWPDEQPQHPIHLAGYWIGRHVVTVSQYAQFVESTGFRTQAETQGFGSVWNGSGWESLAGATWWHPHGPGSSVSAKSDHPATMLAWTDALAFGDWLTELSGHQARLPSEAEWEKTAKGRNTARSSPSWPWGNEAPDAKRCNFQSDVGDTTAVGKYRAGQSGYGCSDMAGNVWEWTQSLFADYPYRPGDGRENRAASGPRVLRGGSYGDSYRDVRATVRLAGDPLAPNERAGFRICLTPGVRG